jgi:DNA-binding IclR family transcriptional regulator
MIGLLDLFEGDANRWTVEQMHERLGYTRSTLYRYLKVLSDAELLSSLSDGGYVPGPRIVELDYEIRRRDLLILTSGPVMTELVSEIPGISLLCRRYREKVLCVHQVASGSVSIESTYERGRPLPLFYGAASRIILAHLPTPHLKRLYESSAADFSAAELGQSFQDVRATLKQIRQRGWDITVGQVTPGITGIAAPIFDAGQNLLGSLSLSIRANGLDAAKQTAVIERVTLCARIISRAMWAEKPPSPPV